MENSTSNNPFLGTGWEFPPRFSPGGGAVNMVSQETDIHQSLHILFSTGLAERSLNLEYGCDLTQFMFAEVSQYLVNSLQNQISRAIEIFEPRILLDGVEINIDEVNAGLLLIQVTYTVKATNSRFNLVWPFYLQEAIQTLV